MSTVYTLCQEARWDQILSSNFKEGDSVATVETFLTTRGLKYQINDASWSFNPKSDDSILFDKENNVIHYLDSLTIPKSTGDSVNGQNLYCMIKSPTMPSASQQDVELHFLFNRGRLVDDTVRSDGLPGL